MAYHGFRDRPTALGTLTGVSSSTVAVLVAHPIETVKVRIQSHAHGVHFFSHWKSARGIIRRPYAGLLPHLVQYLPMNALRFGGYERAKPLVGWTGEIPAAWWQPFAAGGCSGMTVAAILHPLYVIKTAGQAWRSGPYDTAQQLLRQHGLRGLYLTYPLGFVRFGVALSVFFGTYAGMKEAFGVRNVNAKKEFATLPWDVLLKSCLAGGLSGVLTWTSIYPVDVLQSRIIYQSVSTGSQGAAYEQVGHHLRSWQLDFWPV